MLKLVLGGLILMACQVSGRRKRTYIDDIDIFVDPYPFCGHRFVSKDPLRDHIWQLFWKKLNKRVVGGKESQPGTWPWQVALYFNGTQFCGGSLVNRDWVVTAAHCFHDSYSSTKPNHWKATLGEHRLKEKDVFEQTREIKHIILHPKYNWPYFKGINDTPPDYDVAVIRLARPANISSHVYPICLLHPSQTFKPGRTCFLTGWGHTRFNGTKPPALNEAQVKLVSRETCNKKLSYNGKIHERAICAGYEKGGVDACQYDSGGPLSCAEDDQYYLAGMVSWGLGCARPHKYGVYSNMAELTPWVVKTITDIELMLRRYSHLHGQPYFHG